MGGLRTQPWEVTVCHDDVSRPPAPPAPLGDVARSGPLTLTATDGNRLAAFEAHPVSPRGVGLVVMPDVRGLHAYYADLAVRFAEAGVDAVAIDYFGRTAEGTDRTEGFDFMPHVQQTSPPGVAADVAAAAEHLRSAAGGSARAVFTLGFCFGGGYSWRQSADTPGLAGAIGFYGRPRTAMDVVSSMVAPLLMLVAGADQAIPVEEGAELERAAQKAGVAVERVVFDGAPHSFFDRTFAEHGAACAEAWRLILGFLERHGSPVR